MVSTSRAHEWKRFEYFEQARLSWKSQGGTSSVFWTLCLWEATLEEVPKGCAHNKGYVGVRPFWLLGAFESSITGRAKVFPLHHRWLLQDDMGIHDEAKIKIFKHWKILMKNRTWKIVKCLRNDNSLEFCSTKFNEFYKDKGITRQHITHYTPQQNIVAKRMNRTL